ncbi:MAG: hypothetical protein PVI79_13660 [Gammaproteobacteria bacterium]
MLIWVAALHCEAKPVIDYYRLRKSADDRAFDIYRGDETICIVSGPGKLASASACSWVAADCAEHTALAWFNLGIAGTAEHEIGSAFRLHKVVDADSGNRYYPVAAATTEFTGGECLTLGRPSYDYREDCLFDMEASGFMHAALYFSSAELVRAVKVISDNRRRQCGNDRQQVSDLIHGHIREIAGEAEALAGVARAQASLEAPSESWRRLLGLAHFSQTQKNRLRVLWRYLCSRDFDSEQLLGSLATKSSAGSIIETLERISHRDSENL